MQLLKSIFLLIVPVLASACVANQPTSLTAGVEASSDHSVASKASVEATFVGAAGLNVAYKIVHAKAPPLGAVVILPGYTESYLLYDELTGEFSAAGYDVYIMDHRGMGKSGRVLENREIVHVEKISNYVDDADTFVTKIVKPAYSGDLLLFAHSTGGLIGVELLARHPKLFVRAALCAPLLGLKTGEWPATVAHTIVAAEVLAGRGDDYAMGYQDLKIADYTKESDTTTHSVERFMAKKQVFTANPAIQMGGPSNQWINLVLDETDFLPELALQVTTPLHLYQAGMDTFVLPREQEIFCDLTEDCELSRYPESYHEIFRETDAIRQPMVADVLQFFAAK